jgi:hypothetical protein
VIVGGVPHNAVMSTDWIYRPVALMSAVVALAALVWAILSWRLAGPSLRVHCLAYRQELVVRIFNAGRTADSIEHIVLGGRKGGHGGIDLSGHLELPLRLQPGETKRWRLNPDVSPLADVWPVVTSGWASLWLLMGSMRQHRVEVMPFPEQVPPAVGWRLVPRRTKAARYAPLLVGWPIAAWTASPGTNTMEKWLVASLGCIVIVRACWVVAGTGRSFRRRRVERWALAGGLFLSLIELARTSGTQPGEPMPLPDLVLVSAFGIFAVVLAIPGAVVQVGIAYGALVERWDAVRARTSEWLQRLLDRMTPSD